MIDTTLENSLPGSLSSSGELPRKAAKDAEHVPLSPENPPVSPNPAEDASPSQAQPQGPTEPDKPAPQIDLAGEIKGKQSVLRKAISEPRSSRPRHSRNTSPILSCTPRRQRFRPSRCAGSSMRHRALSGERALTNFWTEIGMQASLATVTKFACIGKVYDRFLPHVDKLPSNWTSLYLVTQIPAEIFERLLQRNMSFEELTGAEIKKLVLQTEDLPALSTGLPKANKKYPIVAKLVFTKPTVDDIDLYAIKKAAREIEARLPLKVELSAKVNELWDKRKLARYEAGKRKQADIEFKPDLWDFGREANSMSERTTGNSDAKSAPSTEPTAD